MNEIEVPQETELGNLIAVLQQALDWMQLVGNLDYVHTMREDLLAEKEYKAWAELEQYDAIMQAAKDLLGMTGDAATGGEPESHM